MFRIIFDFRKKIFPEYLVDCVMVTRDCLIYRGNAEKITQTLLIFIAVFYRKHFVVPLKLIYICVARIHLTNTCSNDTRETNRSQGMQLGKEFIEREGQNAHFIDRMKFVTRIHATY